MLLKDLCTTDVVCCGRDAKVSELAFLMRDRHVGDVVVVDEQDDDKLPVGLITDRDITVKVIGIGLDPDLVRAHDVMQMPLVCADVLEDSSLAIERMQHHGIRRLPVTAERGRLVGIVTLDDLLRIAVADIQALLGIVVKEQDVERRRLR